MIIYRDNEANAIFIEDANGAQFLNSLQATVDSNLLSITDTAKGFELVSSASHNDIVDQNGDAYGANATEACDALNAIFQSSGTPSGSAPVGRRTPLGQSASAPRRRSRRFPSR